MAFKSLKKHTKHLDRGLRIRLYLYFAISLILIGLLIYNIATDTLRWDYGILGLIAGVGLGIITSRMFRTSWNKDAKK